MTMIKNPDLDIPPLWENAANRIVSNRWRKILVMGGIDRGKSTFCKYLAGVILESGYEVAVVDADVGQKDIGPPATITLGYPTLIGSFEDIEPTAMYFVGSVTPEGHLLPMVVGTKKMVEIVKTNFVIINTTGLIHQAGRVLKGYKIELIKPDVIVAIEKSHELKTIMRQYRNHRIIRLEPSNKAVSKNLDQRRERREKAFSRYFRSAVEVNLNLRELIFQRTLLFTGKRIEREDCMYSELTSEGVVSVSKNSPQSTGFQKNIVAGFEKNLLCGLANWRNHCVGIGIINSIDFSEGVLRVVTPVDKEKIRIIQPGEIYLEPSGREIGRMKPGSL